MHEAWPSANHLAPPDLAINGTNYVRRQSRTSNLSRLRDEIGIASDHFKGG
jgi:hypothetical protein